MEKRKIEGEIAFVKPAEDGSVGIKVGDTWFNFKKAPRQFAKGEKVSMEVEEYVEDKKVWHMPAAQAPKPSELKQKVAEALFLLPEEIAKAERRYVALKFEDETLNLAIDRAEVREMISVSRDENFKNAMQRDAEVQERLSREPEVIKTKKRLEEVIYDEKKAERYLTFLNNKLKAYCAIARMFGGDG